MILQKKFHSFVFAPLSCWGFIVTLVCTQRFDRKSIFTDVLTSIFLKKEPPLSDEKWAALLIYSSFFLTFKYLWILFLVLFETQFHFIFYNSDICTVTKVIYPKYSKHYPYTVASTIDCGYSKMLNHGFFFHFSSLYSAPYIELYVCLYISDCNNCNLGPLYIDQWI